MTKIPASVWVSALVFITVLTISFQYAPQIVIGFVLLVSFVLSGCTLLVSLAKYMDKK
jgi:hypothetical protein